MKYKPKIIAIDINKIEKNYNICFVFISSTMFFIDDIFQCILIPIFHSIWKIKKT